MDRREALTTPLVASRVALLAVAIAAAGCAPAADPAALRQRFIAEPSESVVEIDALVELESAIDFNFDFGHRPGAFENASFLEGDAGGDLVLRPGGGNGPLWRPPAGVPWSSISAVEVSLAGLEHGRLSIVWDEEESGARGRRSLDRLWARGDQRDRFVFDLAGVVSPAEMPSVAIELTDAPGEIVALRRVRFGRLRALDERREALLGRPFKVSLGDDLRPVLAAAPGSAITRRVRVDRGSRFSAGFGVLGAPPADVVFHVTLADGGVRSEIFRGVVANGSSNGWSDAGADLSRWAGREVDIVLEVEAPAGAGDRFLPLWAAPEVSLAGRAAASRPNLVLISLDTLRADRLSYYGYGRPTSPGLDAWAARRAVAFRNVIAPSGWTLPSHTSLFTGLEAFRHPANFDSLVARTEQLDYLAELLRARGYRTQAFTGGGFVHPLYGFAQGFDSYVSWPSRHDRDDELTTNVARAIDWLEQAGEEPFFLFFHTFEAHIPNRARQPFFSRFSRLDPALEAVPVARAPLPENGFVGKSDWKLAAEGGASVELAPELAALPGDLYDSAVAYLDFHLADLFAALERDGLAGRTVVVVTSDHGEALGEGGRASHGHLYESNLRIPLLVALPDGRGAGRWIDEQVRLIDLFPTLLELGGAPVPGDVDGQSLFAALETGAPLKSRAAWSYAAATNNGLALTDGRGRKLVWRDTVWRPAAGGVELLDLSPGTEGVAAAGADAPRLRAAMESASRKLFGAAAAGIHLVARNRSTAAARLEIESSLVAPVSVKSPDLAPPYLAWKNMGAMDLDLAADGVATLVFQQIESDRISLAGQARFAGCREAARFSLRESVEALRAARRLEVANPCDAGAPAVELALSWVGSLPEGEARELDANLLEELRALGYLK